MPIPAGPSSVKRRHARSGDGVFVVAPEPLPLALAADERPLEMARHGLGALEHLDDAERVHGLRLPLQGERFYGLDPYRVADEQPRLRADEHLACELPPARGGRRR